MFKKIVFDVDDTICTTYNRDYEHSIPNYEVINKIKCLHDKGYFIALYTSRGMASCNGDLEKIVAKNEAILKAWLKRYDVQYDELIFCKPLADLYVDDKAMNVKDFLKESFYSMQGGSGCAIEKMGNLVKKQFKSVEEKQNFEQWNNNNVVFPVPQVVSYLYDAVYMDYVQGDSLAKACTIEDMNKILTFIEAASNFTYDTFNLDEHLITLRKNLDRRTQDKIDFCTKLLRKYKNVLKDNASFSHGDCTLANILKTSSSIVFIDPILQNTASSWLLDLAKLKMSVDGYEHIFFNYPAITTDVSNFFNNFLIKHDVYKIVTILEYMYILRLYRYKNDKDKEKLLMWLNDFEKKEGAMLC